jgi:3,4-dihydroxy 2-butanone 4-phosphate synthase/GTP cyclohydrolase II
MVVQRAEPTMAPVEDLVDAIEQGSMVILVDNPERENEGDLVIAGRCVDGNAINFMATHARGLICMPMEAGRLAALAIPPMTRCNTDAHKTAFHVGVDARHGTTTGISAHDRALTALALSDPDATARSFVMPGHLFPLAAHADGLSGRLGHTEASVELARLAGHPPAAVICEIADDDGRMARVPRLVEFAADHGLLMGSVEDVADFAARRGRVKRVARTALPLAGAPFTAVGYRDGGDGAEHVALVLGDLSAGDALVHVHAECLSGDVFASRRCECAPRLRSAIDAIRDEGRGAIVYLRSGNRGETLLDTLFAYARQDGGRGDDGGRGAEHGRDACRNGAAAAILRDLGVPSLRLITDFREDRFALESHRIQVTSCVPGDASLSLAGNPS